MLPCRQQQNLPHVWSALRSQIVRVDNTEFTLSHMWINWIIKTVVFIVAWYVLCWPHCSDCDWWSDWYLHARVWLLLLLLSTMWILWW